LKALRQQLTEEEEKEEATTMEEGKVAAESERQYGKGKNEGTTNVLIEANLCVSQFFLPTEPPVNND